jgi:hypothetical protein
MNVADLFGCNEHPLAFHLPLPETPFTDDEFYGQVFQLRKWENLAADVPGLL